jgi:hypothetical protein
MDATSVDGVPAASMVLHSAQQRGAFESPCILSSQAKPYDPIHLHLQNYDEHKIQA